MAITNYGVNSSETNKVWAKKLFHDTIRRTYFSTFLGTDNGSAFVERTELSKNSGDRVTVTLRANLSQDGIASDGQVEGNEEALSTFTDSLLIDSLDAAVKTPNKGTISQQRVPFEIREESKDALADWWAERLDICAFNQLAGYTAQTDLRYTGNNATIAPTTGRIIRPSTITTDENLTNSHPFTLSLLEKAVTRIKTRDSSNNYRVKPIRVPGYKRPVWVAFVHPWQMNSLRTDASTAGNFFDLYKAALQGGLYPDNPIFTGASFDYNGVLVHESESIPYGVSGATGLAFTTARRAVLVGAQSLMVGFGKGFEGGSMTWQEETFNYGKELGTDSTLMFGMKKAQFNSKDFSSMVISTYAAEP